MKYASEIEAEARKNRAYVLLKVKRNTVESCEQCNAVFQKINRYCENAGMGVTIIWTGCGDRSGISDVALTTEWASGKTKDFLDNGFTSEDLIEISCFPPYDDSFVIPAHDLDFNIMHARGMDAPFNVKITHIPSRIYSKSVDYQEHKARYEAMDFLRAILFSTPSAMAMKSVPEPRVIIREIHHHHYYPKPNWRRDHRRRC